MSYLPRMSKTYKEPQAIAEEPEEDFLTGKTFKIASSLLNEKSSNPMIVLKHYLYLPHSLPVLPGPSVLEEVIEHELSREASRMRRSATKMKSFSKASESISEEPLQESNEEIPEDKAEDSEKVNHDDSKKSVKGTKIFLGKKKFNKAVKKRNTLINTVNMCLVETDKPFTATEIERCSEDEVNNSEFLSKDELESLKKEKTVLPLCHDDVIERTPKLTFTQLLKEERQDIKTSRYKDGSVQCTIFESTSKLFVVPLVINSLLRILTFLLHETNKEEIFSISKEKKILMTQIQLLLNDLCNQKMEKEFGFETTYSDYKRLDVIYGELKNYLKSVHGDKGDCAEKVEDFKKSFMDLKKKEMELAVAAEKLQELEDIKKIAVVVKEDDLKNPEVTFQNKILEYEQLTAEVEFGRIEIGKCQNAIAGLDWDIRHSQGQMTSLKKSAAFKSKAEMVGRKSSAHKFSCETPTKTSRNKEK